VAADLAPIQDAPVQRATVAAVVSADHAAEPVGAGRDSDRLVGVLVHRLLQRKGVALEGHQAVAAAVADLVRRDERLDFDQTPRLVPEVYAAYRELAGREDVRELYRRGECFHEVPFSFVAGGRIIRGSIDCLVRTADRVTVLEFKTGRPRVEHREQLALYIEAARALFPGAVIDGYLLYAGDAVT
jgi:ATP-dependent helicase/nuclease subunit A